MNEASPVVVDQVYRLCQLCGQLSLATQMPSMSLVNTNDDTYLFKARDFCYSVYLLVNKKFPEFLSNWILISRMHFVVRKEN